MERVDVYLGLGSNEGDRDLNLLKAMNLLDEAFGTHPERISRIVETPAWGFERIQNQTVGNVETER